MATLKAVCVMKGDGPVQGVIHFQQQARAGAVGASLSHRRSGGSLGSSAESLCGAGGAALHFPPPRRLGRPAGTGVGRPCAELRLRCLPCACLRPRVAAVAGGSEAVAVKLLGACWSASGCCEAGPAWCWAPRALCWRPASPSAERGRGIPDVCFALCSGGFS